MRFPRIPNFIVLFGGAALLVYLTSLPVRLIECRGWVSTPSGNGLTAVETRIISAEGYGWPLVFKTPNHNCLWGKVAGITQALFVMTNFVVFAGLITLIDSIRLKCKFPTTVIWTDRAKYLASCTVPFFLGLIFVIVQGSYRPTIGISNNKRVDPDWVWHDQLWAAIMYAFLGTALIWAIGNILLGIRKTFGEKNVTNFLGGAIFSIFLALEIYHLMSTWL